MLPVVTPHAKTARAVHVEGVTFHPLGDTLQRIAACLDKRSHELELTTDAKLHCRDQGNHKVDHVHILAGRLSPNRQKIL